MISIIMNISYYDYNLIKYDLHWNGIIYMFFQIFDLVYMMDGYILIIELHIIRFYIIIYSNDSQPSPLSLFVV